MTITTPADARLLRTLAVLVESLPDRYRAGHLGERCREFADRIDRDAQTQTLNEGAG